MINKFNDKAIAEAAYYIWKNNGCPANSHAQDWNAAINQLSAMASVKTANSKLASAKVAATRNLVAKAINLKTASSKSVSALKTAPVAKKTAKKSK